jgi:DNA-binding CsgD family transcriptional regulator
MNRLFFLSIITLNLLFGQQGFSQVDDEKFSRAAFKADITNVDVIDAKRWHHQGEIDKSLKKGLEIVSSNIELTSIDSFNTYQILAYNFRIIGAHSLALDHAIKSIEIKGRIDTEYNAEISWVAPYFSAAGNHDSAIVYLKKELEYHGSSIDTLYSLKKYNDLGFTFFLNNQLDSAIFYYNKVTHHEDAATKYPAILGLTTGNLGAVYLKNKEYEKALINLKVDASLSKERNRSSYYHAMNAIGECYLLMKNYSAAKNTLLTLLALNHQESIVNLKTYKLLADVYHNTNQSDKSAHYLRKFITLKDSLQNSEIPKEIFIKQLSDAKINGIKKDLELAKNKAKSEELKKQAYLVIILLSIIMLAVSIAYFINRQKKKVEIQKLETNLIKAELKNKKKDLTNVVTNLSYKRKFIDEVQQKLKSLQNQPEAKINEHITLLIREFSNYKNADKSVEVLQADIDKVNLYFFERLGNMFPLLTEKEKELCGFLMLKLTTKDIANIRNVTPDAVKKARQRIRKKLPISENQELTTFLETI